MEILALDLAGTTGFCFGTEAGVQAHGSFALPITGCDYGTYLIHYRRWLFSAIDIWRPSRIVYESPILLRHDSAHHLRKIYCLGPRTEEIAQDNGIEVGEASLNNIRKHFLGARTAPKEIKGKSARRKWIKEQTISICRRHGFRPVDDNDADAIALFSYAMSNKVPGFVLAGSEIARAAA